MSFHAPVTIFVLFFKFLCDINQQVPDVKVLGAGFFAFAAPDAITGLAALLGIYFMIEKVCIHVLKEEFVVHRHK